MCSVAAALGAVVVEAVQSESVVKVGVDMVWFDLVSERSESYVLGLHYL